MTAILIVLLFKSTEMDKKW